MVTRGEGSMSHTWQAHQGYGPPLGESAGYTGQQHELIIYRRCNTLSFSPPLLGQRVQTAVSSSLGFAEVPNQTGAMPPMMSGMGPPGTMPGVPFALGIAALLPFSYLRHPTRLRHAAIHAITASSAKQLSRGIKRFYFILSCSRDP